MPAGRRSGATPAPTEYCLGYNLPRGGAKLDGGSVVLGDDLAATSSKSTDDLAAEGDGSNVAKRLKL